MTRPELTEGNPSLSAEISMQLSTPIEELKGVGPVLQKRLKRLKIKTVRDLIFHFPSRYENFSNIVPIAQVKTGGVFCIEGKILTIKTTRTWARKMTITEAIIEDNTGSIKAVWFNQFYISNILKEGDFVCMAGKVSAGKNGSSLQNPVYEKVEENKNFTHVGRIIPVYPETTGISSRWFRYLLKPLLYSLKNQLPETLPKDILDAQKFLPLEKSLWQIHFPDSMEITKIAQERFSFEELFYIELSVLRERIKILKAKAQSIPTDLPRTQNFVESLPFKLTDSQKKTSWQILKDMEKTHPMNRLLEGDVGSGKTVVATLAALNAAKAGQQIAIMAPTEILAKQHFQEISKLLFKFKLSIALLTGKADILRAKKLKNETIEISRKRLLDKIYQGEIDLVIGTHALIQKQVKFNNLALVIIDEQHRFGVEQRAKLCRQKNFIPHLLSMTATPIPRTLALTIYGDLDLSVITELPKGRKKIITKIIEPKEREDAYNFIRQQIEEGRQAFVICPKIEKKEKINSEKDFGNWAGAKAVEEEYEKLSKEIFPDLRLGMLHGKMASKEKERVMRDFKIGKTKILVSTSVVEVGIDVPNATIMMIEGSEHFGLAQLHQFRGRVGRSVYQSYCLLFSESSSKKTHQRLVALVKNADGFSLSQEDLEQRGPGDFAGRKQWGLPDLVMSALKDITLVERTRAAAKEILEKDPQLKKYPLLLQRVEELEKTMHQE